MKNQTILIRLSFITFIIGVILLGSCKQGEDDNYGGQPAITRLVMKKKIGGGDSLVSVTLTATIELNENRIPTKDDKISLTPPDSIHPFHEFLPDSYEDLRIDSVSVENSTATILSLPFNFKVEGNLPENYWVHFRLTRDTLPSYHKELVMDVDSFQNLR